MRADTRLDVMRVVAQEIATEEIPLALEPQVYCVGNSRLAENIADHLNLDDLVQFAAEKNHRDPDDLSAMGIVFEEVFSPTVAGVTAFSPQAHEGKLHYPFIWLPVHKVAPQGLLNFCMRHELRHPFQPAVTEIYQRPKLMAAARVAGAVTMGAELGAYAKLLTSHGQMPPMAETIGAWTAASSASIIATANPAYLAWYFSRNEWDANAFAARTRSFKPVRKH